MDEAVRDILDALRGSEALSAAELDRIVRAHSKKAHDGRRLFAKKRLLAFYLAERAKRSDTWESWKVDAALDGRFMRTMQMKPRRTASGVATITVITKPWPCRNNCVYCPNDPRMPKSYLSDEPACQRAERNGFHPYLQVASRLRTLAAMGHATDKIELIILGGTWNDYPAAYREWFISELFRGLNDSDAEREQALSAHEKGGLSPSEEGSALPIADVHAQNEGAKHRVVGLVVETRPDAVSPATLADLRRLGCTKVQLGVQSIDAGLLARNGRRETPEIIAHALGLARLFGFKTHAHFMLNLLGATPASDTADYRRFVTEPGYLPDEVKLYPCALVGGTQLVECYESGQWAPYTEEELLAVLSADMKATPPFVRVSRMIRDISAKDILVGNKKTNLRQLVDERLAAEGAAIAEIRFREIATQGVDLSELRMEDAAYDTASTREHFLQWLSPDGSIAGFLRLSLPSRAAVEALGDDAPVHPGEAMIREVHVYGFATRIAADGVSAQHHGLGRTLVERACAIARDEGYAAINVISAVGTREYYRKLGFEDSGPYQQRSL